MVRASVQLSPQPCICKRRPTDHQLAARVLEPNRKIAKPHVVIARNGALQCSCNLGYNPPERVDGSRIRAIPWANYKRVKACGRCSACCISPVYILQ